MICINSRGFAEFQSAREEAGGAVGKSCGREGNSIVQEGGDTSGGGQIRNSNSEIQSIRALMEGDTMDSNHEYCLKWNSFGSNLTSSFSELYNNQILTDVTLYCEGKKFKAHRLILAACSKHFQEIFHEMPLMPGGVFVILDGTSSNNLEALLEFMYRGEVNISQADLSPFLKAADYLQVKGLSLDQDTLAIARRLAEDIKESKKKAASSSLASNVEHRATTSNNNVLTNGNGTACSASSTSSNGSANNSCVSGNEAGLPSAMNVASETAAVENGLARSLKRRTPTPAPTSPATTAYNLSSIYANSQYYDSPQKRLLRSSPSEIESLSRASVLRDGAAFRPASAPHPSLLENHLYQSFSHHSESSNHPRTAPHTPELENELDRERSEEKDRIIDSKEGIAEDLRIKQEPVSMCEQQQRIDKLTERLTGDLYGAVAAAASRVNYERCYPNDADCLPSPTSQSKLNASQMSSTLAHLSSGTTNPTNPALWNSKINKADTVNTSEGKKLKCPFCDRLYGYETNLRAHIRQRHQGIRVHCPFCSRTFTRNNTVRRHIAREHRAEQQNLDQNLKAANEAVNDAVPQ